MLEPEIIRNLNMNSVYFRLQLFNLKPELFQFPFITDNVSNKRKG